MMTDGFESYWEFINIKKVTQFYSQAFALKKSESGIMRSFRIVRFHLKCLPGENKNMKATSIRIGDI